MVKFLVLVKTCAFNDSYSLRVIDAADIADAYWTVMNDNTIDHVIQITLVE